MCGLAGFLDLDGRLNRPSLERIANAMSQQIGHRGPDDVGVYCEPSMASRLDFSGSLSSIFRRAGISRCCPAAGDR